MLTLLKKNSIRLLFAIIAGGIFMECFARLEDWLRFDAKLSEPYSIESIFRPSLVTGKEGIPGARFKKWHLNELGYRGEPLKPSRERVLFYGASETFGLAESDGMEYPAQFRKLLEQQKPLRYDVVNAAIPGLRIGRIPYLNRALETTQAKYVFVYPSPANYIDTPAPYCNRPVAAAVSEVPLSSRIRVLGKLRDSLKTALPENLLNLIRTAGIEISSRNIQVLDGPSEQWKSAFEIDLNCVIDRVVAFGAKPYLITHATYFGKDGEIVNPIMMRAWRSFYPNLSEQGFLAMERRFNESIARIAKERNIPLVKADELIAGGGKNFADFVHFTDSGAKAMADAALKTFLTDLGDPENKTSVAAKAE